jgi:hypothetical protein
MEKELSYGDCFNFIGSLFSGLVGNVEVKKVDNKENSKYYSNSRRHTLIARECKESSVGLIT